MNRLALQNLSHQKNQKGKQFQIGNSSQMKESPFFSNNIKSNVNPNMFSISQVDKENIFSAQKALQQTEPAESKFGGSYQIFESMITEGIKDIEQIFYQNDIVNRERQRRAAFNGFIDIQNLEKVVQEGYMSEYDLYGDEEERNNYLQIPVPTNLFDEESAIKKSLNALNDDYAIMNSFNVQTFEDDYNYLEQDSIGKITKQSF